MGGGRASQCAGSLATVLAGSSVARTARVGETPRAGSDADTRSVGLRAYTRRATRLRRASLATRDALIASARALPSRRRDPDGEYAGEPPMANDRQLTGRPSAP